VNLRLQRPNYGSTARNRFFILGLFLWFGAFSIYVFGATDLSISQLPGRIVAVGIPGAGAITPVGSFHAGSPIHDNPKFQAYTQAGAILDPKRILVAGTSNFGAPRGFRNQPAGAVLSIDPARDEVLVIPPTFAGRGDQACIPGGRVMLFTANSAAFLNGVHNQRAITARLPPVANPTGISLNNAFGRIWITSAPFGSTGIGLHSVVDPDGCPLDKAPSSIAGGVFAGTLTNREPQLTQGSMATGAIATALLGKSPDGSSRAVFAGLHADGSVVQVHVEAGVEGLAPPGTVTPIKNPTQSCRRGMVLNWVPDMILYITDSPDNSIVALTLRSNGRTFEVSDTHRLTTTWLNFPIDISPAIQEAGSSLFSSNTTLAGGADLYVANRGNDTVVRLTQDGTIVAVRRIAVNGVCLSGGHLNGIAVSPDADRIWVTATGSLDRYPEGAVIELPAFGAAASAVND
jgi:hypothetical protein